MGEKKGILCACRFPHVMMGGLDFRKQLVNAQREGGSFTCTKYNNNSPSPEENNACCQPVLSLTETLPNDVDSLEAFGSCQVSFRTLRDKSSQPQISRMRLGRVQIQNISTLRETMPS